MTNTSRGRQVTSVSKPEGCVVLALAVPLSDLVVKAACEVVIDGTLGDCQHAHQARDRVRRQQIEHDGRAEAISRDARKARRERIAGVVERLVAADAPGEGLVPDDPQGDRSESRAEDGGGGMGGGLRDRHVREIGHPREQERRRRDQERRNGDGDALCPRRVDERSSGRLCQNSGGSRNRHHDADAGLVPFLHRQEIDREIGAKPIPHVGQEEVGGVERTVRPGQISWIMPTGHRCLALCCYGLPLVLAPISATHVGCTGSQQSRRLAGLATRPNAHRAFSSRPSSGLGSHRTDRNFAFGSASRLPATSIETRQSAWSRGTFAEYRR